MIIINNKKCNKMKKSSFVMCAMLIAFCMVFVSCKEEKKEAPTIKFTYDGVVKNNGEEVEAKVGKEITIIVEYDAPGKINQIFLRVDGLNNVIIGEARASGFDKKTAHKIIRTLKLEEVGDVQITTSVEDKQKETLMADFELKVKVK
jgi:hypothetical protein